MSTYDTSKCNENRGPELIAILWTFTTLAIFVVLFKIYTRVRIIRLTGLDDVLIFFSAVLVLICTILFTVDVHYGMGRHTSCLSTENAQIAVKMNLIANPFGIMAYSIPNIAVAIFIDRILPLTFSKRLALYILVILQNFIAIVSCVLLFTQCSPQVALWNPRVKPERCFPANLLIHYSYFVGAFTALTDVVLAAVPIWTFRKLNMPRKAKVATSIIMGMTLAAAVCSIVKTSMLYQLADLSDFPYGTVDLIITAVVEADVIIIAACIPSLRPFVLAVGQSMGESTTLKRLMGSTSSRTSQKLNSLNWMKLSSMGNDSVATTLMPDDREIPEKGAIGDEYPVGIRRTLDYSVTASS